MIVFLPCWKYTALCAQETNHQALLHCMLLCLFFLVVGSTQRFAHRKPTTRHCYIVCYYVFFFWWLEVHSALRTGNQPPGIATLYVTMSFFSGGWKYTALCAQETNHQALLDCILLCLFFLVVGSTQRSAHRKPTTRHCYIVCYYVFFSDGWKYTALCAQETNHQALQTYVPICVYLCINSVHQSPVFHNFFLTAYYRYRHRILIFTQDFLG